MKIQEEITVLEAQDDKIVDISNHRKNNNSEEVFAVSNGHLQFIRARVGKNKKQSLCVIDLDNNNKTTAFATFTNESTANECLKYLYKFAEQIQEEQ